MVGRALVGVVAMAVAVVVWAPGRVETADDVTFSRQELTDPETIAVGRAVWLKRCKFCHSVAAAYPGKGPKLKPSRYTPRFVYDRVTNGFRGMPSWKAEFSEQERKAVVAYVLSKRFPD